MSADSEFETWFPRRRSCRTCWSSCPVPSPAGKGTRHEPFHGRTKDERFKACLAARRAARDAHHHAKVEGLTAQAVADAHRKDLETQGQYDVNYIKYWFDEGSGQVWCLVEAPDADTAMTVHREAHGLVADDLTEVQEGA